MRLSWGTEFQQGKPSAWQRVTASLFLGSDFGVGARGSVVGARLPRVALGNLTQPLESVFAEDDLAAAQQEEGRRVLGDDLIERTGRHVEDDAQVEDGPDRLGRHLLDLNVVRRQRVTQALRFRFDEDGLGLELHVSGLLKN